jgi:hypothetical protein
MGAGFAACSPIPGSTVPVAALGECTASEGGTDGGTDAADSGAPVDAGGQ